MPQIVQHLGSWSGNVSSWLDRAPGPKLLLRYEDLLAEPAAALAALARFTGLEVSPAVRQTVAATSFQSLQAAEALSGFAERMTNQRAFFRQGQAGAWRKTLSAAQAERLWNDHHAVMARWATDRRVGKPALDRLRGENRSAVPPPGHRPGHLIAQDTSLSATMVKPRRR